MNLTQQPPRRPSNLGIAGIVGAARMVDKARAHNNGTLGDYLYGDNSGLDRKVLALLGISADAFAEAADADDDETLGNWLLDKSGITRGAIEGFNKTELERLPETEEYVQRLKDRLAKYAPGRTDIRTVLQSVELDDWGNFWQTDLTKGPPRSANSKAVSGVFGVARMADKARSERAGKNGDYRYGNDSGQDRLILNFLKISPEEFQEAAVNNPNDSELGAWVSERSGNRFGKIVDFNHMMLAREPEDEEAQALFNSRIEGIDSSRTDITTWTQLQDLDDELTFGIIELARHAPRSPYNTDILGIMGLARTLDKAKAFNSNTLGVYRYGFNSGHDRHVLGFLGIASQEFADAMKALPTDKDAADWIEMRNRGKRLEIYVFNKETVKRGPADERQRNLFAKEINRLDPNRTDIQTFFDLIELADEKEFE